MCDNNPLWGKFFPVREIQSMNRNANRGSLMAGLVLLISIASPVLGEDVSWPKILKVDQGDIEIYQFQLESLTGNSMIGTTSLVRVEPL